MKKEYKTENKSKKTNSQVAKLDGITVDGIPFIALGHYKDAVDNLKEAMALSDLDAEQYEELYRRWRYQENRTLRHECSLERQGAVISALKKGVERFKGHLDRIERIMDVQDRAILYWNGKYDSMKLKFQTALAFAIASIIGFSLATTYIVHLEQGWTMPLFDAVDKIVFHQPDNPNAYPMYWTTPNGEIPSPSESDSRNFSTEY